MNDNMKIYCNASHNWSLFLVYSLKSFHLWITNISVLYLYTTVCVMKTMLKYLSTSVIRWTPEAQKEMEESARKCIQCSTVIVAEGPAATGITKPM